MRKKETLIVAVLVNAGLLMILFATATKSPKSPSMKKEVVVEKREKIEKKPELENLVVQEIELEDLLFQEEIFEEEVVQKEEPCTPAVVKEVKELREIPEEFYVVKEGDNPWLIASKNKVKLSDLLRLNHLDDKSAKRLRPGDRLRIR